MVFIFVNSFDLCLSVSDGSSFDGGGRGDDAPDLTLAGPLAAHLGLLPPAGVKVISLYIYSFILESFEHRLWARYSNEADPAPQELIL